MNDMSHVIVPKSDQINADDLISGPMTITIESVQIKGGQEQPVSIYFAGSDKAFRPCKSMSRVLVAAWGPDANKYVGRSLTLYRDPKVKWGGMEVGGIRISHMSHIDKDMVMALTATKGRRDPYKVRPMADAPASRPATAETTAKAKAEDWLATHLAAIENAADEDALSAVLAGATKALAKLERDRPELYDRALEAAAKRVDSFDDPFTDQPAAGATAAAAPEPPSQSGEPAGSDLFVPEGRSDADMGEAQPPLDRALLLVAVAASTQECMDILNEYVEQLDDADYDRLRDAADARGKVLVAAQGAKAGAK